MNKRMGSAREKAKGPSKEAAVVVLIVLVVFLCFWH